MSGWLVSGPDGVARIVDERDEKSLLLLFANEGQPSPDSFGGGGPAPNMPERPPLVGRWRSVGRVRIRPRAHRSVSAAEAAKTATATGELVLFDENGMRGACWRSRARLYSAQAFNDSLTRMLLLLS